MINPGKYKFKWTFRDYQQAVLDNADQHLRDGKIHIVAAPGSGKTILGLELISRLSAPTLILSPSVTIKQQWGERFEECFCSKEEGFCNVFSFDLRNPKDLTSITYQALHAALKKEKLEEEQDWDSEEAEPCDEKIDFADFDLMKVLKDADIRTICLDEAHHLRSEWRNALDFVITELSKEKEIKIIALTATPPYDSTGSEWDRYISLCGEIDEEIFVPQLVTQKTLCPHQDYIYFNYPTEQEEKILKEYKDKEKEINAENEPTELTAAEKLENVEKKAKEILKIKSKEDKILMCSIGKLKSISDIVTSEVLNMRENLRMLILTDFIRKDMLDIVGTEEPITQMGTVPVFETVRRLGLSGAKLAMISGSLVIIPNSVSDEICSIAETDGIRTSLNPIAGTDFSQINFSGSNKSKVGVITKALNNGLINVLVGTKSLLGEGWDSPCINSLILASFVGSFMLSNQMRGRAIRTDKNVPNKVSNIWHLVTLEPSSFIKSDRKISGSDYETVKRRFECFIAPSYSGDVIESGIDRIDILKPPFNEKGIAKINAEMLDLSGRRNATSLNWDAPIKNINHAQVTTACSSGNILPPAAMTFNNIYSKIVSIIMFVVAVLGIISIINQGINVLSVVLLVLLFTATPKLLSTIRKHSNLSSPKKCIETVSECVFTALRELGEINSKDAYFEVSEVGDKIMCNLKDGTAREKTVFAKAMAEMLSPIDDPRYIIIRKGSTFTGDKYDFTQSYACPSILSVNKDTVGLIQYSLSKKAGDYELVFAKSEKGKNILAKCKERSFLNKTQNAVSTKRLVA